MTETDIWAPLAAELDRWRTAGRTPRFWLRDDDAVEPTGALARLLDLTHSQAVPLTLAVIPAHSGKVLADDLATRPHVAVAVHGWSHDNHAGPGEKKQELGGHRPGDTVLAELGAGFSHLSGLHGGRFVPVLVPPWNRIDASLVPRLADLGYEALSVFGPEKASPLRLVNTHVDIMDWHGTRGGRDHGALVGEIVARLRETFDTGGTMGLLTHHLVHDAHAWAFLERLFEMTSAHTPAVWVPLPDTLL